jgi:hypothetical protein
MQKDTYLLLRVTGTDTDVQDPVRSIEVREATPRTPLPEMEYQVDTAELDDQEYRQVRADRNVAGIARPMPVQLVLSGL